VQHRNNHQIACTKLSWFTGIVIFAILNQEASFFFWTNVSVNANSEGFPDSSNDTHGILENTQHVVFPALCHLCSTIHQCSSMLANVNTKCYLQLGNDAY